MGHPCRGGRDRPAVRGHRRHVGGAGRCPVPASARGRPRGCRYLRHAHPSSSRRVAAHHRGRRRDNHPVLPDYQRGSSIHVPIRASHVRTFYSMLECREGSRDVPASDHNAPEVPARHHSRDAPRRAQIRQVRADGVCEERNDAGSSRTPFPPCSPDPPHLAGRWIDTAQPSPGGFPGRNWQGTSGSYRADLAAVAGQFLGSGHHAREGGDVLCRAPSEQAQRHLPECGRRRICRGWANPGVLSQRLDLGARRSGVQPHRRRVPDAQRPGRLARPLGKKVMPLPTDAEHPVTEKSSGRFPVLPAASHRRRYECGRCWY